SCCGQLNLLGEHSEIIQFGSGWGSWSSDCGTYWATIAFDAMRYDYQNHLVIYFEFRSNSTNFWPVIFCLRVYVLQ
ncbi:MAG: hypothetical protein FWC82_04360, partial [Firmicutes bacterium]|nr:hypothetical protein [Bacillota bacterium]